MNLKSIRKKKTQQNTINLTKYIAILCILKEKR